MASITFNIIGGTPWYDVHVFDSGNNDIGVAWSFGSAGIKVISDDLIDCDTFRLEVTDANGCIVNAYNIIFNCSTTSSTTVEPTTTSTTTPP